MPTIEADALKKMFISGRYSLAIIHDEIWRKIPFTLLFQLDALFSKGLLDLETILDKDFQTEMAKVLENDGAQPICNSLRKLGRRSTMHLNSHRQLSTIRKTKVDNAAATLFGADYSTTITKSEAIATLCDGDDDQGVLSKAVADTMLVFHAMVTPSRIFLAGPYTEQSNRITRQYRTWVDRFLRVTFVDEDMSELYIGYSTFMDDILNDRIRTAVLGRGIRLCGRHYEFLAFSSSQLRESSCWFYAGGHGAPSLDTILAEMGDFSGITVVAKCAARIGQCFTASRPSIQIKPEMIPDVTRNAFVFSDGIGQMSSQLAEEVFATLGVDAALPCAYQIRLAGAKGIIAVEPSLTGRKLLLRPSIVKFDSPSCTLDIVRMVEKPTMAYLNCQAITLLSQARGSERQFLGNAAGRSGKDGGYAEYDGSRSARFGKLCASCGVNDRWTPTQQGL